jgi:APA family basic amino acid/polyamine antiporter
MSESSDLPRGLAVVSVRTGSPMRAEVAMAALAIVAAAVLDPLWLVGLSSATVLSYYAIGHLSVLRVPRQDRRLPVVVAWLGLAGCVSLVFALPAISLVAGAGALTLGAVVWWGLHQRRRHAG